MNSVSICKTTSSNVERHRSRAGHKLEFFAARPRSVVEGAPTLVAVHGVSRNAFEQAEAFSRLAESLGIVVVAPHFDRSGFPAYQRLGKKDGKQLSRPVDAFLSLLDHVEALTGADTRRIFLFGYSGGAQFSQRFAMAHPHRVRSLALGAPGWLTFPDALTPYPYGIANFPVRDPRAVLAIPTLLLVGDHDRRRDGALNLSRRIDGQQGRNRVERGMRWISAMQRAARLNAVDATFRFTLLPRCGHSFGECVEFGGIVNRSARFFFDQEKRAPMARENPATLLFSSGGA